MSIDLNICISRLLQHKSVLVSKLLETPMLQKKTRNFFTLFGLMIVISHFSIMTMLVMKVNLSLLLQLKTMMVRPDPIMLE